MTSYRSRGARVQREGCLFVCLFVCLFIGLLSRTPEGHGP